MHDPKTAPYKAKSDKILRTPSLKNANMHKIVEMLTNMMLNITTSLNVPHCCQSPRVWFCLPLLPPSSLSL